MRRLNLLIAASALMATAACEPAAQPGQPVVEAAPAANAAPPSSQTTASARSPQTSSIVLVADGLQIGGQAFAFDAPAEAVHAAVAALWPDAAPAQGTSPECGPGPLDYSRWDDLTLWFQNDRFMGWEARGPGLATASDAHAGMTRPQLEAAGATDFDANSLGVGFSVGEVHGIIGEGETTASVLFSGANCFAG